MPWRRRRRVIEEQAPPVPPPRPLIWPWLVLLLLLVGAGIAAAYLLARDDDESGSEAQTTVVVTPATVEVPRVVGLSVDDAVARLASSGLKSSIARVASRRPRNRVLRQEPPPGTMVERGGAVVLTVSRGLAGVRVPRVTGLTEASATARLDRLGFKVSVSRIQSSRQRGIVISQEPRPRTRVPRGSVVGINVSRGPATTTPTTTATTTTQPLTGRPIPNVVGLAQRDAVARLQGAGFRVDSYPAASSRPRGTVLAQRPSGGTRAPAGSRMRIDVSLGSGERPLRTIPDVTGMPENEAKQTLVEIGFTVRGVDQPAADDSERGVVLSQTPAPGGQASAGSQVVLRVVR